MSIDLTIYGLKGNSKVTETVVNGDLPVTTNGPFSVCPQCNLSSCTFLYIINNCYFYPLIQISQNGLLAIIIYLEQKKFSVSLIDHARKYICYSYSPYKTFVGFYRSMFFKMCLTLTIWKTCPNTAFLSRDVFLTIDCGSKNMVCSLIIIIITINFEEENHTTAIYLTVHYTRCRFHNTKQFFSRFSLKGENDFYRFLHNRTSE